MRSIPGLGLLILFALSTTVSAQITITSSSLARIGTVVHKRSSTERLTVDPDLPGENQLWDLRGYECPSMTTEEYVDPATTEYSSTFPTSTICVRYTSSDGTVTELYRRLQGDHYESLGGVLFQEGFDPSILIYEPPLLLMTLPFVYGSPATINVTHSSAEILPGVTLFLWDSTVTVVDGWGTVLTDSGSYEVLRTYEESWGASWFAGETPDTTVYSYFRWKEEHGIQIGSFGYQGLDTAGIAGVNVTDFIQYVDVPSQPNIITNFSLLQNYPNPFNSTTQIRFDLPATSQVQLRVYDIMGREVNTLIGNEQMSVGSHVVSWNGTSNSGANVASGTYICRIEAGSYQNDMKMILLK